MGTEKHVAEGKICSCGEFVKWLDVLVSEAKERHKSQTTSVKFARSRLVVGALLDWLPFQIIVGEILVVNFGLEVHKTQVQDIIFEDLGHPAQIAAILESSDKAFLVIFTLELLLNLYARWMWTFLSSSWRWFDALVIAMIHD